MSKILRSIQSKTKEKKYKQLHSDRIFPPLYTQPSTDNSYLLSTIHFYSRNENNNHLFTTFNHFNQIPHTINKIQVKPIAIQSNNTIQNVSYKLCTIEAIDKEDLELRDTVEPMNQNEYVFRSVVKPYFKYGRFERPTYINNHFEKLIKDYYSNKENAINFLFDIYLVPHFKCNLFFFSLKIPMSDVCNIIETSSNLLEPKVNLRLCLSRKLRQLVKDNYAMTHLDDIEKYDFTSLSFFNNKSEHSEVVIASDYDKRAVFNFPLTFNKKYKQAKTKGFMKRLINSQTGIHSYTLTNLLKLHLDLHKTSAIFNSKSVYKLKKIQKFTEVKTK